MGGVRHRLRHGAAFLAAALVLGSLAFGTGPAEAQDTAPAASEEVAPKAAPSADPRQIEQGMTTAELEALVETLENDAERKKFLGTLEALIAARKAGGTAAPPEASSNGLTARVAEGMSRSVQALGDRVAAVIGVLQEAPRLLPWLESWFTEGPKRDRLLGLVWRFIVIVGIGMGAQYLFRRATGRWRERLERDADADVGGRILRFVLRTGLLYGNAFAYGAGAAGALLLLPMSGGAGQALIVGASSFFAAKLILATTRMIFAPGMPMLRAVPVSDETAAYLYIWVRRLVRIFVYAFFFLYAAFLVGLPAPAYRSFLYIFGLALVAFLVVFVLQNRNAVASAMRSGAGQRSFGGLRTGLAATWHAFAIFYIVAVYAVWLFEIEGGFEFLMRATGWTVLALLIAKLLVLGAGLGIQRLFRVSTDLDARFPGLEARANRYVPVLGRGFTWLVYIGAGFVVLDVWGVDTLGWLASTQGTAILQKAVTILLILLAALIAWEALALVIGRYLDRLDGGGMHAARARTLLPLLRTTALIVIAVLVALIVLSELGVNIAPLLAGAGVVGLAIGFGAQKLVQDVITGLFMLIEDTLAVGDVVQFDADHDGIVEAISIRTVRLRDLSGNVHTLPFSEVKTTLNMTKGFGFYLMDIGVAYRENVDHVIAVLKDICEEMREDPEYGTFITEPLEVLGLDSFGDSAIVIKARIRIVPPIRRWFVGREFNRRMKARFDAEGIEIPFPHRTLYFGEDKAGNAPPAYVAMVDREEAPKAEEPAAAPARPSSTPSPGEDSGGS